MSGEQFSLCWDNFHKNMSSGMHALLESEDLVDVTLAVEGKYLKAHKMVLSVCSPYFRELFQTNPCKHPIVFMKDVSFIALSDLLTFMYQGEVQVNQENLATFIKTAEALQIKGLTGDGNGEVSDVPEETFTEETSTKRTIHEVEEPKPKKPATYPAKRPKIAPPTPDAKIPKTEQATSTPSTEQIIQFKMEPYESADQTHLDDSQADNFGDVDDSHIEDTEDYSMLEGEEEPQAGTSGDGMGDSQDRFSARRPVALKLKNFQRIVYNGFLYHVNTSQREHKRYYVCGNKKKSGCAATAVLPKNAGVEELVVFRPHNHPPDEEMEMKYNFEMALTKAIRNSKCDVKSIYDSLAEIYPEAAHLVPFDRTLSKRLKKRRLSPHNLFP